MNKDTSEIVVHFLNSKKGGEPFIIKDWTAYSFESDFFLPADAFTLELDSTPKKIRELLNKISLGDMISLSIAGIDQAVVYIEKAEISYDRDGGSTLVLSGRDQFGLVCDSNLPPDVNITANSTYMQAILEVLKPFGWKEENIVGTDNAIDEANLMQISCGQAVGSCISTRNGTLKLKNLDNQLKRQLKPQKGEGRVTFIQRICKRAGWTIKLLPPGDLIWIGPPIYERKDRPYFNLVHKTINENGAGNNVLEGNIIIDWSKQPSYIVGEATANGGKRRKSVSNVVKINDLTGIMVGNDGRIGIPPVILDTVSKLSDKGYYVETPNINLINSKIKLIEVNETYNNQHRALYIYDDEAKNIEELRFSISNKMAEFNNSFVTLEYEVDGHINNGAVWQINMMCKVDDDTFGGQMDSDFWIQKRRFTKSRSHGTKTELTLKLPYVYGFEFDSPTTSKNTQPPAAPPALTSNAPNKKSPPKNSNTAKKSKPIKTETNKQISTASGTAFYQTWKSMYEKKNQATYGE